MTPIAGNDIDRLSSMSVFAFSSLLSKDGSSWGCDTSVGGGLVCRAVLATFCFFLGPVLPVNFPPHSAIILIVLNTLCLNSWD